MSPCGPDDVGYIAPPGDEWYPDPLLDAYDAEDLDAERRAQEALEIEEEIYGRALEAEYERYAYMADQDSDAIDAEEYADGVSLLETYEAGRYP